MHVGDFISSLLDIGKPIVRTSPCIDSMQPAGGLALENISFYHTMESGRRMHHAGYNIVHPVASHPKEPG